MSNLSTILTKQSQNTSNILRKNLKWENKNDIQIAIDKVNFEFIKNILVYFEKKYKFNKSIRIVTDWQWKPNQPTNKKTLVINTSVLTVIVIS